MGLKIFALCFFFFIFFSLPQLSLAKTYELSLSLAEKMALNKNHSRSIYAKEKEIKFYSIKEKNFSLFPSLSASLNFSKQHSKDFKHELSFFLRQKIPNPFKWIAEKKALKLDKLVSQKKIEENDFKILENLRKKFFRISALEKKVLNTKKNLKLLTELKKEGEYRFSSGSISSYDLKRILIKKRQIKSSLAKLYKDLLICLYELKILIGLDKEDTLKIEENYSPNFSHLSKENLTRLLKKTKKTSLLIKGFLYQKSEREAKASSFYYLPSLSLGARYGLESKFSIQADLTWEIFSGGSSYYKHRRDVARKELSYFEYLDERDLVALKGLRLLTEFKELKENYKFEKLTLKDTEEILSSSKLRFKNGTLSSQDLNSDVTSYIQQENIFLEIRYKTISALSEFSTLLSDRNFFLKALTKH